MHSVATHQAIPFALALFAPDDLIEIRPIAPGRAQRGRRWVRAATLADHIEELATIDSDGFAIYFGVCPRKRDGGGTKADVAYVRAFWADLDNMTPGDALSLVRNAGFPDASIVVKSGRGCHVYWLLKEPTTDIDRAEGIMRGIASWLDADSCFDASRILRLPGFYHRKDPTKPILTEIVVPSDLSDPTDLASYSIDEFQGYFKASTKTATTRAVEGKATAEQLKDAIDLVERTPPAIEGQGGRKHTFALCAELVRDRSLSINQVMTILEGWNARCIPPWTDADLRQEIKGALERGENVVGSHYADAQMDGGINYFPPPPPKAPPPPSSPAPPASTPPPPAPDVDPFAPFRVSEIQADPETWTPVEHITTGIKELDTAIGGGFRRRSVICVCGKTGRGKTTLCVQCAANAAEAGIPTVIVSLELDRQDVLRLLIAAHAKIPRTFLDRFDVRGEYGDRLLKARNNISQWPLWIIDADAWKGPMTRVQLAIQIADGVKRHGWKLAVVDYLGLIANLENDKSQYQADVENSTALKAIARQNDIALVAVASLRKSATYAPNTKKKADAIPTIDDLLGAGRLAYDAVSVLYIDSTKSDYEPGQERTGEITVSVLKSRYTGASSTDAPIALKWYPSCGRIVGDVLNIATDDAPF